MKPKVSSLKISTKLINLYPVSSRIKGREFKSIKLEMKKKLQQTSQKYKGSKETARINMVIKWTTQKKLINSSKGTTFQD